jgi:hypothetical protein
MDQNKSYIADIYVRLSKEDGDDDTGNKYESNSKKNMIAKLNLMIRKLMTCADLQILTRKILLVIRTGERRLRNFLSV